MTLQVALNLFQQLIDRNAGKWGHKGIKGIKDKGGQAPFSMWWRSAPSRDRVWGRAYTLGPFLLCFVLK